MVCSCDSTEEWFEEEVNDAPTISFTFLDNEITELNDSIKFSKNIRQLYEIDVTVKDPQFNVDFVFFDLVSGEGSVFTQGLFTRAFLRPTNEIQGKYNLTFQASDLGIHKMNIVARDTFEESDSVSVRLTAFENLPPVAKLEIRLVGILSKYEYILDASDSFDRDEKYGGNIVEYEYTINSQVISREEDKISHIFSKEGVVVLALRVKDSDGVWSQPFETVQNID